MSDPLSEKEVNAFLSLVTTHIKNKYKEIVSNNDFNYKKGDHTLLKATVAVVGHEFEYLFGPLSDEGRIIVEKLKRKKT